jgi:hypothetical protein
MISLFVSNDLGDLVLWAGLGAMFVIVLIVASIRVPDRKKK